MFLNPQTILNDGIVTLPSHLEPKSVLQPNGIDLYAYQVYDFIHDDSACHIGDNVQTRHLKTNELSKSLCNQVSLLQNKAYRVETQYRIKLPKDVVALIVPRSSLNRNGIFVGSGLWDSGFEGTIGSTIYCFNALTLHLPARFAQICFMRAESLYLYEGQYKDKQ